jgi:hypothetical protein
MVVVYLASADVAHARADGDVYLDPLPNASDTDRDGIADTHGNGDADRHTHSHPSRCRPPLYAACAFSRVGGDPGPRCCAG